MSDLSTNLELVESTLHEASAEVGRVREDLQKLSADLRLYSKDSAVGPLADRLLHDYRALLGEEDGDKEVNGG